MTCLRRGSRDGLDVLEDFFVPTVSWVEVGSPQRGEQENLCIAQPPAAGQFPPAAVAA